MNLGEIATYVCNIIGQTDDRSQELCRDFINARHKMIYSTFPWKDSEMQATATLNATESEVDLPDDMEMVIAIRANGDTFLDPVSTSMLMQTDPGIFERTGLPTCYQELTDDSNVKKIQVFPTPKKDTPLLIVGKRTVSELQHDVHSPILRGVDNVLIAYAMRDMLERGRQYGKAKEKLEEAGALLKEAQALETSQSNQARQTKNITVAGNSLSELVDAVSARTGVWAISERPFIKDCLRRQYQRLYDIANWPQSTVMARVNSDGAEIILPVYFDKVISVRVDATLGPLAVAEPSLYYNISPSIFEQSGIATTFSILAPVAVKFLPPISEKLSFISSSTGDMDDIFVMGEYQGSEVRETVALKGAVAAQTRNSYDTPLTVSKPVTAGNVSVYGASSGVLLETIPYNETEQKHLRIWVQPVPSATECLILGKRKIRPLVTDNDSPLLTNVSDILISSACADVFSKNGKGKEADDMRSQASAALKSLIEQETNQGAYSSVVVPCADGYGQSDYYSKAYV